MKRKSFLRAFLKAAMNVRTLALFFAMSGFLISQSAEAQSLKPAQYQTLGQGDINKSVVAPFTLPDGQWGFRLKEGGEILYQSHDLNSVDWSKTPSYASQELALTVGELKKKELISESLKPKTKK